MSSPLKNVALLGASGNIGKIILDAFVGVDRFNVTIITRAESEATFPAGFTVRKTEYTEAGLTEAFKGQDAVISAVGMGGFAEQTTYIDAAIAAGVKRFIPSEFSANTLAPGVRHLLPLFNTKMEVLEYLKKKQSATFSWTAIWTALLFDWGLNTGFLDFDIKAHTATIWDDGSKKVTLINEKQLGASVIATLDRPQATANKNLYVASFETSQNEILAAFEKVTGAKWTVTRTTTPEQVDGNLAKLHKGDFSGAYPLVRASSFASTPDLRANYVRDEELSNDLLGLEFESVEESIRRVLSSA